MINYITVKISKVNEIQIHTDIKTIAKYTFEYKYIQIHFIFILTVGLPLDMEVLFLYFQMQAING